MSTMIQNKLYFGFALIINGVILAPLALGNYFIRKSQVRTSAWIEPETSRS